MEKCVNMMVLNAVENNCHIPNSYLVEMPLNILIFSSEYLLMF